MAHDHSHEHGSEYFVEQLFTILVCGALGLVAVRLYMTNKLGIVLAPPFHLPVLIGGIAILVLVALRAIAVWRESGQEFHDHAHHDHGHDHHHDHGHGHDHHHDHGHDHHHNHGHDHHHDHDHGHDHAHDHHHAQAEDHGHSHDLSWTFARLLILSFPVALYLLGVPNATFSPEYYNRLLGKETSIGDVEFGAAKNDAVAEVRFDDLNNAAYDAAKRESFQGQMVTLVGRMRKIGDKEFTLFKLKMTCCVGDTVPLKVRIVSQQSLNSFTNQEWVRVTGQLQFVKAPGSSQYIPVIKATEVVQTKEPPGGDFE